MAPASVIQAVWPPSSATFQPSGISVPPLPWMRFSRGRCAFSADLDASNLPARSPPQSSFGGARCHADRLRRAGPDAPRAAGSKGGRAGVRAR